MDETGSLLDLGVAGTPVPRPVYVLLACLVHFSTDGSRRSRQRVYTPLTGDITKSWHSISSWLMLMRWDSQHVGARCNLIIGQR